MLKHELGLPLVSTFHTLARVKAECDADHDGQRARAEAQVIGCSDAILALSADEAVQLERLYQAVPQRVEIVPPGVDQHLFSPGDKAAARAALGLGADPVLLFVGRIQPLKGVDVAVRTLCQLNSSSATLVVVGGPERSRGRGRAGAPRSGSSSTAGYRDGSGSTRPTATTTSPPTTAPPTSAWCPAAPSPSGWWPSRPPRAGTPVVAANVGGLATLVDPGVTGFLVEGRDPAVYAGHVAWLLDDPEAARTMGSRAAARARGYRWSTTAGRLRRIYADLDVA